MRRRTAVAVVALIGVLAAVAAVGLGLSSATGELTERWVSDTPRDNEVNHHAVGVGPAGDVVVAPIAEVPHSDVEITDTSCALVRLAPTDGEVRWRTGLPAEDCFTHALTEPTIRDVDSDGSLEAVVSSTEDALVTYGASDGIEEWRVNLSTYGYGRPTVGDVTGDGRPDVVTSTIAGDVVVVHGNGTVAWRFDLNDTRWARPSVVVAPVVADVDGDDRTEVLLGANRGPILLTADGSVDWQRDGEATYLTTAQVDDDAALEVFTAGTSTLRGYDGESGSEEWVREMAGARVRAAADADEDGTVELFVGRGGGEVLALDATTGETEWSTAVGTSADRIVPGPVLGDVDGDGSNEVVAVTNTGTVAVLAPDTGAELGAYERAVPIWTIPTTADLDDDGRDEVLVRYGDGRVVALDFE